MTVPGDGVETMRPRNCLTSLRTPKEEGPAGEVNIKNWMGRECQLGQRWLDHGRQRQRKSEKTTMDQQLVVRENG